jgi:hypothetical protein
MVDIAQLLHVDRSQINTWIRRYASFPRPVTPPGPLWLRSDVVAWAAQHCDLRSLDLPEVREFARRRKWKVTAPLMDKEASSSK